MNILFLSPTGTLDNGAEESGLNLMSYLQSEGHRVYNVFPSNEHQTGPAYKERLCQEKIAFRELDGLVWWWPEAPVQVCHKRQIRFAAYQTNLCLLRQMIREHQIDVVISNTANVFLGAVAAACEQVSHFWLIHEFPFGEFAYYKEKLALMVQLSDAIFAVEGELYQQLSQLVPESCPLYPFFPFSNLDSGALSVGHERRLVSIGRLTERKNQLELLEAYRFLQSKRPPLLFIGDWDEAYKAKLDDYITSHGLEDVGFLGYQDKPWQMVTDQDICVLPSALETYGLVYLEALLKGVPTLVSDNPGFRSVHHSFGGGSLYPLGEIATLTEALQDQLDNFGSYQEESQARREEIKQAYTIQKASQAIKERLELVEGRKKPLAGLESLLGSDLTAYLAEELYEPEIRVYFKRGGRDFREEDSRSYPLASTGVLRIDLKADVEAFRLDFSERPSLVRFEATALEDFQLDTNGLLYQGSYIFLTDDPQLIFTTPNQEARSFSLNYSYQALFELSDNHLIYQLLAEQEVLKQECQDAQLAYQQVVTSRRWTIPTKIIDFFRRNK